MPKSNHGGFYRTMSLHQCVNFFLLSFFAFYSYSLVLLLRMSFAIATATATVTAIELTKQSLGAGNM